DLRGIAAVGVEGDGLGVLVVVGVEQQATQVGFGAGHAAVVFQQGAEAAHELGKARQRLLQILLGHEWPPCRRAKVTRSGAAHKLAKPGWRGKAKFVALYY